MFATKPALAARMIDRFTRAGHHAAWVTADEVYGGDPRLRDRIERLGLGYVLAVACNHPVPTRAGTVRADTLAAQIPARAWQRISAGPGAKGHRLYDWALVEIAEPGHRHLLVRRHRHTGEMAYYRCHTPGPVPLSRLVAVAGVRWRIEETFQAAKGLAGLDQHQLRRHTSWARWTALAMAAHAFLAVTRATEHTTPPGLIRLSCNEIRHLFITLTATPAHTLAHRLAWSTWRRRHQHRSRTSHYQRQTRAET